MSWDADDELPPRALLDAWEVPSPSSELENAIMTQLDAAAPAANVSRRANALIVPLLAGIAAAALIVAWLAMTRSQPEPATIEVVGPGPVQAETEPAVVQPTAELGVLTIVTEPDDAEIRVDGKPVDGPSPFIIGGAEVGKSLSIEVSAPGRLTVERNFTFPGDTSFQIALPEKTVMISTELTPSTIELELEATSDNGTIRRPVEPTFLLERDRDTDYFVVARAPHHLERRLRIGFTGRSAQFIDVVLEPDPRNPKRRAKPRDDSRDDDKDKRKPTAKTASLLIGTNAGVAPAEVYIDGKFIGHTPQGSVAVTPGRHTVKWVWGNGKKVTQSVTLADGQRKVVKAG